VRVRARIKGTGNGEARMSCFWDAGVFLFSNGFDKEALECANDLPLLANQSSNQLWLRKSYLLKGIAHAHIVDSAGAITLYWRALELAKEAGDYDALTSVLGNIGTSLNYCGLHREAIPCITTAIEIADAHPTVPRTFKTAALCNLAQSYLYLGEFERGFKHISVCLERSEEPRDAFSAFSRVVREYTFVQLALELGKLGAARKHSKLAFQYSKQSQTKRSQFLASTCQALCEIHGGDVSKGLAMLETALHSSNERGVEYVDSLKALVKGYDLASRPEEALERLNLLIG